MAIIESLSVAKGGGVVSSASQSRQRENVVNIFIGLGGTGTDAIRCIKKQVNEHLIPDNAYEYDNTGSNVYVCEYSHIKYLSVDSDQSAYRYSIDVLDKTEKLYLSFSGPLDKIDYEHRLDLNWLNQRQVKPYTLRPYINTSGIRQFGRLLFYENMDEFEERIYRLVQEAKCGITRECRVVIHILSGVSGGTGSGIFLDACYAVRKALSGITNKMIVGYFFMPDVNLSVKALDASTRKYITGNAYAALQELNYCMGFPDNGGSFRQITKDGTYINWDCRPVDMCHIVGAQTENLAKITDDAYDYAMHTVAEYVMNYLIDDDDCSFDIYSYASVYSHHIFDAARCRRGGYDPFMLSLGVACANIPYREINTYLVSGVFKEYSNKHTEIVTQSDAEEIINKAWNVTKTPLNTMIDKLYASILKKLSGDETRGLQGYSYYQDSIGKGKPWEYLLKNVNTNGDNELETFYQNALNSHIATLATNADRLLAQDEDGKVNKESLLYQLDNALDPIVKDINRGPQYAKNIIDYVEGANVLNLIAGLKAKNNVEFQNAEKDRIRRYEDYLETKRKFFNRERQGFFDNDKKRYQDFEDRVVTYVQLIELVGGVYSTTPNAKPVIGVFEHIDNILNTLEKQIRDRIDNYFAPLCSVLSDLTDTFEANYKNIINITDEGHNNGFSRHLVSFQDQMIISFLDEQIINIPMSDTFSGFMGVLIDAGYDVWQKREERLPKTIQSFFVGAGGIFRYCANMTVDTFLEKKYSLTGRYLEQKINDDYFGDLMNASSPLLPIDGTKLDNQKFYRKYISFPHFSSVISNTLDNQNSGIDSNWIRIPSSTSDRLVFLQIRESLPLQACAEIGKLENQYYMSSYLDGSHLYEENGIYEDMIYSDWRTLPSITLPSVMSENIPEALKFKRNSVKQLFDKAVEYGVIKLNIPYDDEKEEDYTNLFDVPETLQKEIDGITEEIDRVMSLDSDSEKNDNLDAIQTRISELLSGKHKELTRTDILLKQRPYRTDIDEYDRILKLDFLYASPVYQIMVQKIIDKIDSNLRVLQYADNRIKQLRENT